MTLMHGGFLSRVFKINELKTEVANHLAMLEKKVERECPFAAIVLSHPRAPLLQPCPPHPQFQPPCHSIISDNSMSPSFFCFFPAGNGAGLFSMCSRADPYPQGLLLVTACPWGPVHPLGHMQQAHLSLPAHPAC